jgi:hypothetical protein
MSHKDRKPQMITARLARACISACLIAIACAWHADTTTAQDAYIPTKLTEEKMAGYVAALPEISAAKAEMPAVTEADNIRLLTTMSIIAKKHGFVDLGQYVEVAATVGLVMSGFDLKTKVFTEPSVVLEQQIESMTQIIAELKAGLTPVPPTPSAAGAAAKASDGLLRLTQMLDEMKDARKSMPVVTIPGNVALVKKYLIDAIPASPPSGENK